MTAVSASTAAAFESRFPPEGFVVRAAAVRTVEASPTRKGSPQPTQADRSAQPVQSAEAAGESTGKTSVAVAAYGGAGQPRLSTTTWYDSSSGSWRYQIVRHPPAVGTEIASGTNFTSSFAAALGSRVGRLAAIDIFA
ncbi:MAG TPA: hypothetical protein VGD08_08815 [Stellaceae bacterium]|jgi:hypothetical protein